MEPAVRPSTWGEVLKKSGFDLRFKALSYFEQYSPNRIVGNNQQLYLLGQKIASNSENAEKMSQQIYQKFCNIPWMTYRSGFSELLTSKGDSYISDSGWGCMIRSGQNCFIQILKRHLKLSNQEEMKEILALCDDFDKEKIFSIQNIARQAKEQYQLEPGVWYNPSQIIFILQQLFENTKNNPYLKTLNILIMNSPSLFYDKLVCKMTNKAQICNCKKDKVVCYKCDKKQTSLALFLLVRIGLGSPEAKYLRCLDRMMESKHFQGIVGGKPTKALYIVGKQKNRYIYLDPHCVNNAVGAHNFQKQKESYFCQNFRSCKNTSIDPSIGLSFYFQNLEDIDEFYNFMTDVKRNNPDDFFLFMDIQTPEWMKKQERQKVENDS